MMMKCIRFGLFFAGALIGVANAPASATTYIGHRTMPLDGEDLLCCSPGTADFSLTTDGTIGSIDASNLVAWQFTVTDSIGSASFDQTNSHADFYFGAKLIASAQDISFDFGDPAVGAILFRTYSGAYSFYCLQCHSSRDADERVYVSDHPSSSKQYYSERGIVVIASTQETPAVPEPATWAMMIIGFGAIGGAVRTQQRFISLM